MSKKEELTEFCWTCRKEKPKDQVNNTKGEFYSGVCDSCKAELEELLKVNNASLVQSDRKPEYSGWYRQDSIIRDIAIKHGEETFFIRGFNLLDPQYESSEVFNLVKQFIQSGFKTVKFYGNLEYLKDKDFWFHIEKVGQFYHFGGNCFEVSNAFNLKTVDLDLIFGFIEVWTPFPESLKKRIKDQIDKGLVFCSNPRAFEQPKQFCFKEYTNKHQEPKIMILNAL